jgi:hypothetical protein
MSVGYQQTAKRSTSSLIPCACDNVTPFTLYRAKSFASRKIVRAVASAGKLPRVVELNCIEANLW